MLLERTLENMTKKLIEVALPLDAINEASRREKSPFTKNHPRALHVWWARRPLAACRAVLFASVVDDPSSRPDLYPTEAHQDARRQELFRLIEELVRWESTGSDRLLQKVRSVIAESTGSQSPTVYDPFCGGGSIPIEAQRLGLRAIGTDLNPVAVLITKALIELPPTCQKHLAINPETVAERRKTLQTSPLEGLFEDLRYYGRWITARLDERVGRLYPTAGLPVALGGKSVRVSAWLWARTVTCPNPACGARMPLIKSFALSTKRGKMARLEPIVDVVSKTVGFKVKNDEVPAGEAPKIGRGAKFRCLVCKEPADDSVIKRAGIDQEMGSQLLAMVVDAKGGRLYLDPDPEHARVAKLAQPDWVPDQDLSNDPRNIWCIPYGLTKIKDLFTPRQLVMLSTMAGLIDEARQQARKDGADDSYANAITTYLALALSRMTDFANAICSWDSGNTNLRQLFSRQAIPMSWDYAESNLIDGIVNLNSAIEWTISSLRHFSCKFVGEAHQLDAAAALATISQPIVSTDPPYYDNIAYADLSDFFYVWLRRCLAHIYPALFATLLVPKAQELVATPYRFGGSKEKARDFFEERFRGAFAKMRLAQNADYPLTVYYAFKQTEAEDGGSDKTESFVSTGWETMLEGLLDSEFQITGTWPIRTEQQQRSIAYGTNALASSIVLVCRPRLESASVTTRKDFVGALKKELPGAVRQLKKGNIAPVDLAQAAIGPGMGVFSRYKKVLESDGSQMGVRAALGLINQALDEALSEQEGDFDPDTRWALAWFEQHAFDEGLYGEAEVLATAKALSVAGMAGTGILHSRAGKVRLLRRDELSEEWDPTSEHRLTVWSVTQHLIRQLDKHGETSTATLASKIGGLADAARDLAYRLYILSERKGWAEEAGYYNSLVVSWPAIAPKAFALS